MRIRTCFLAGILAAAACGGGAALKQARIDLARQAEFDLGCPREDLELRPLSETNGDEQLSRSMGVYGCGKRATYLRTHSGWILNSSTR